ncbi:TauD/TfdA family dioxygenase [Rhodovibrionaceae bacterium A322]
MSALSQSPVPAALSAAERHDPFLKLTWNDGFSADYLYLWLRDNCPSGFHPQTQERTFDLLSVSDDLHPLSVKLAGDSLAIDWSEGEHSSQFSADWLREHCPGQAVSDAADPSPRLWDDASLGAIPSAAADDLMASDETLLTWMRSFADSGLALVTGLGDSAQASQAVGERIGFLRRTNFGMDFSVQSKPDPNNLAYTALALPLHTDLPNQELPPGYQFLHCQINDAQGGGSLFADGFRIIEDLRCEAPDTYEALSRISVPYRFHDGDTDLRIHRPVIGLDSLGQVRDLRFNAHIADIPDMPAEEMARFYPAYRELMRRVRQRRYRREVMLQAGEMVVFDNRRVLHGRAAFDPTTGRRQLFGFYVDRGEFDSRLRVLARQS